MLPYGVLEKSVILLVLCRTINTAHLGIYLEANEKLLATYYN